MTERDETLEAAREAAEAKHVYQRGAELILQPVEGKFDAAHLREINRRLFQDMPGLGFGGYTPGEFRPPVLSGHWMKHRKLETVPAGSVVAYSPMNDEAKAELDEVLATVWIDKLRELSPKAAAKLLSTLYAKLDYIHPFPDGNSRTLRMFTEQVANAAGFDLNWRPLGATPTEKDKLYIARDMAVNERALPQLSERAMMRVATSMAAFRGRPSLSQLLDELVSPRAETSAPKPEDSSFASDPDEDTNQSKPRSPRP